MRAELIQLEKMTELIAQAISILRGSGEQQLYADIADGINAVNLKLYGWEHMIADPVKVQEKTKEAFIAEAEEWLEKLQKELQVRRQITKKIDYDFYILEQHILLADKEMLVKEMLGNLLGIRKKNAKVYRYLEDYYNTFSYFWGKLHMDAGELELLENRAEQLTKNWEHFRWLYDELADYRSKKVLYGILHYWLNYNIEEKSAIKEYNYDDYYDLDLLSCGEGDVVVDLGAYTGDSALSYIKNYGLYKKIYCYEITKDSMEQMQEKLAPFSDIIYRNVGVGSRPGVMYIQNKGMGDSCNQLGEQGEEEVKIVALDDDIGEPVTLIKMDIEGAELEALEGAARHIKMEKPKLAVCTYHNNRHIWEIPRKMKELNPEYKLYMRYNGHRAGLGASEYVTFAL